MCQQCKVVKTRSLARSSLPQNIAAQAARLLDVDERRVQCEDDDLLISHIRWSSSPSQINIWRWRQGRQCWCVYCLVFFCEELTGHRTVGVLRQTLVDVSGSSPGRRIKWQSAT